MNPRAYWRFVVVAHHFAPLALAVLRDRRRFLLFGRSRQVPRARQRARAERLRESLVALGPTFVKLGQILSTRPDVLPPVYVEELEALQDEVPPAPWDEAKQVVEDALGPVDERFDDFQTEAISGASLGQVYRAEVDGQAVAVKVRRPGVRALVEADLRVVRWSLPIVARILPEAQAFSLDSLADEFATTIREEMDYEREARMLTEIRGNFADRDDVVMPEVIDSHATERVLTMEYVPGTRVTDVEAVRELPVDHTAIATRLQRAYFQMVIEDGVFHADPHPGNLAVQDDGTLVFYDFGMSGRVDDRTQELIVDFYTAVVEQDVQAILDALIALGTLSPDADRRVMGEVMELAIADARGEAIEEYRVNEVVAKIEDTMYEFPFRLPPNLALVLRVATVVEGVCVTIDPQFNFVVGASSYLQDSGYLASNAREAIAESSEDLADAARASVAIPPKLEAALDRLERDDVRVTAQIADDDRLLDRLGRQVVLGMVFSSGLVATAVLYSQAMLVATGVAAGGAGIAGLLLWRSFREPSGIEAKPSFTRQEMAQRRDDTED